MAYGYVTAYLEGKLSSWIYGGAVNRKQRDTDKVQKYISTCLNMNICDRAAGY